MFYFIFNNDGFQDGQYEFESKECLFWISKIFQLAIDWQLNLDDLRIHQIVSLYAKGHDRLAEEVSNCQILLLSYYFLKINNYHV